MAQGRFRATGTISLNSMDSPNPWIRRGKTKAGADYVSMNCSVVAAKNNRMYCELFGMKQDKIRTMDTDNNKIEIAWSDRLDPDVIKTVANYRKVVVNLGEERIEFISAYDAIEYIERNEQLFKNKMFTVTGQITKNIYNGKITDRFQIQNIYAVDESEAKPQLRVMTDFVWDKDSVDIDSWADEKKVYINGWVMTYINSDEGNKYVPQQIVLDCSKIDLDNEKHVAIMKFKLDAIGVEYVNGKLKVNLKKNTYYKLPVECSFVNGAEEIQFSEDELTDYQKQQVELGLKTVDDFRPKGSIYGQRVVMYKLLSFDTRDDYADGKIALDDDISDEIYIIPTEEKANDVFGMNPPAKEDKDDDDSDEDLFD